MPISIIMVSYHTGAVLFDAIQHVLAASEDVELCLVDNGNPPDDLVRLMAIAKADARFQLITGHGNVGFGTGCNLGARAAKGEWLLFLNPDSLLPVDAVQKLLNYAAKLSQPFMIGARLLDHNGRDQRGCRRALLTPATALIEALHLHKFFPKARLNFHQEAVPPAITPVPAISGAFMFLAATDFWRVHGFDEHYFLHVEDLDLCYRFTRAAGTIYFAPDIVVTHIGGTSKATSAFIEKHKAAGFRRYFHTHFTGSVPWPLLGLLDIAIYIRRILKSTKP